ncbi:MAG TPA: homoserine kinase [Streptosporangiaceae bacterium]|nr:homoserine kinase [Streptosporangiaceae bacterium]
MVRWPDKPVTVRVPATSANLGPGFDSLGLALSLHDTVRARVLPSGLQVTVTGAGAGDLERGEGHLVIRAMRAAFAAIGAQPPGLEISCGNDVPQGFGLGSSAAAIVSGVLAARALAGADGAAALPDDAVLRLATELEGHPDNVAACLLGGLTVSWTSASVVQVARLTPLAGLAPVLCVPAVPLSTQTARKALPAEVPHAEAAANSARAALLIAALTLRPDLLLAGTEDFLHQPYRAAAMPATAALIERLRTAGIAAVVSGAGPSVLALTVSGTGPGPDDVIRIAAEAGPVWRVLPLEVDADGAVLLSDLPAMQPPVPNPRDHR